MMLDLYKRLIVLPVLMCVSFLNAQDVLDIRENRIVKAGETFTIKEGTLVKLGAGVTIDVRGNLVIKGTKSNPVRFVSADPNNPAMGITLSGIQEDGNVQITGAQFDGLIQPLRFDPFWYRKSVSVQEISIKNGKSYEPVVYMASPFIDLREGKKISVKVYSVEVINNQSGMLIEAVGSNGISHEFDKLYFGDNQVPGGVASFGMLHLDFADAASGTVPPMGRLAFERNTANGTPLGLSVNGSSSKSLSVAGIYGEDPLNVVFDQKKDARVPMVSIGKTGSMSDFGAPSYIDYINHNYGDLSFKTVGDLSITELSDEDGNLVEITRTMKGDTQHYAYIQGKPTVAKLSDGRKLCLPTINASQIPGVEVTKIDTAEYNKFKRQVELNGGGLEQSDVLTVGVNIPTFAKKGEVVRKLRIWEFGFWGGGAAYGGGDIKHRRFKDFPDAPDFVKKSPIIRDIPLFSTLEISLGLYGQYNINSRFSVRASYYHSRISMWNLSAQGLFARSRDVIAFDDNQNKVYVWGYGLAFVTDMNNVEVEGLWHLRPYKLKNAKKSQWIPTLGLSLGLMHFNPYRYVYNNGVPGSSVNPIQRISYLWGRYVYEPSRYNLRDLGSEGQNFLPGQKPYSSFALNAGGSFQLTYMRKRWALKGEMKFVYTSTDYLDDFGPGIWYGGDIDKVKQNHKYEQITPQDLSRIIPYNSQVSKSSPRSIDGLNDWYYQAHLGYSYFLFQK